MINDEFMFAEGDSGPQLVGVYVESPCRCCLGERLWECRVEIPGQLEPCTVVGVSPIQATALALDMIRSCLEGLAERGRLSYRNGDEVSLTALFGKTPSSSVADNAVVTSLLGYSEHARSVEN